MRVTIAAVLLCVSSSAFAVDFTKPILDIDGKPVCQAEADPCPADKVMTLARVARIALGANYPDEQNLAGDEKYKRGELAQSLVGVGDIKLKSEDRALIKKLIGKLFNPTVVYSAWNMLEQ